MSLEASCSVAVRGNFETIRAFMTTDPIPPLQPMNKIVSRNIAADACEIPPGCWQFGKFHPFPTVTGRRELAGCQVPVKPIPWPRPAERVEEINAFARSSWQVFSIRQEDCCRVLRFGRIRRYQLGVGMRFSHCGLSGAHTTAASCLCTAGIDSRRRPTGSACCQFVWETGK